MEHFFGSRLCVLLNKLLLQLFFRQPNGRVHLHLVGALMRLNRLFSQRAAAHLSLAQIPNLFYTWRLRVDSALKVIYLQRTLDFLLCLERF